MELEHYKINLQERCLCRIILEVHHTALIYYPYFQTQQKRIALLPQSVDCYLIYCKMEMFLFWKTSINVLILEMKDHL